MSGRIYCTVDYTTGDMFVRIHTYEALLLHQRQRILTLGVQKVEQEENDIKQKSLDDWLERDLKYALSKQYTDPNEGNEVLVLDAESRASNSRASTIPLPTSRGSRGGGRGGMTTTTATKRPGTPMTASRRPRGTPVTNSSGTLAAEPSSLRPTNTPMQSQAREWEYKPLSQEQQEQQQQKYVAQQRLAVANQPKYYVPALEDKGEEADDEEDKENRAAVLPEVRPWKCRPVFGEVVRRGIVPPSHASPVATTAAAAAAAAVPRSLAENESAPLSSLQAASSTVDVEQPDGLQRRGQRPPVPAYLLPEVRPSGW